MLIHGSFCLHSLLSNEGYFQDNPQDDVVFLNIAVVSAGCHPLGQAGQMAAPCGGPHSHFPTALLVPCPVWTPHSQHWTLKSVRTLACLHSEVEWSNWIQFFTINSKELPKCVRHVLEKPSGVELEGLGLQAQGDWWGAAGSAGTTSFF